MGGAVTDWVLNCAGKGQITVSGPHGDTEDRPSLGHHSPGTQGCPAVGGSTSSAFCCTCQDDDAVSILNRSGAQCNTGLGQLLCAHKRKRLRTGKPLWASTSQGIKSQGVVTKTLCHSCSISQAQNSYLGNFPNVSSI
jgi:hypothetical protein